MAVAGGEDGTPATFGVGTRGVQLPVTYSSCQWVVPCAADETLRVWFNWIQLEDTDEACQHVRPVSLCRLGREPCSHTHTRSCPELHRDIERRIRVDGADDGVWLQPSAQWRTHVAW